MLNYRAEKALAVGGGGVGDPKWSGVRADGYPDGWRREIRGAFNHERFGGAGRHFKTEHTGQVCDRTQPRLTVQSDTSDLAGGDLVGGREIHVDNPCVIVADVRRLNVANGESR